MCGQRRAMKCYITSACRQTLLDPQASPSRRRPVRGGGSNELTNTPPGNEQCIKEGCAAAAGGYEWG